MGLVSRRFYKPERRAPRKRGVLTNQAPVGCPDASALEIATALAAICEQAKMQVGRGGEYDALKDTYTIVGKMDGKAQDLKVEGVAVAALINQLRVWNGFRPFDPQALRNSVGGLNRRGGLVK